MKIREILRKKGHDVLSIAPDRSVLEAVGTLVDHNVGSLLVLEGERLAGIITERDVLRLTARKSGEVDSVDVGEVMTRDLVTTDPDAELHDVMEVMTRHRIRHLPVLEGEELVGLVSIGDLVDACRVEAEQENTHLKDYIRGAT